MLQLSYFQPILIEERWRREFDSGCGAMGHYLSFLLEGSAVFTTGGQELRFAEGQLLYIPKGLAYRSHWEGSPRIRFYSLMFDLAGEETMDSYALQTLEPTAAREAERMEEICRLWKGSWQDRLTSSGKFLELFASMARRMEPAASVTMDWRLLPALRLMENGLAADRISNAELAERCFLSPSAFYSAFKQATGCTPVEYKNRLKVRMAMELLMNTSESLECICRRTGFSSPAYLRRVMYRYTGRKPHEIRQGRGALC